MSRTRGRSLASVRCLITIQPPRAFYFVSLLADDINGVYQATVFIETSNPRLSQHRPIVAVVRVDLKGRQTFGGVSAASRLFPTSSRSRRIPSARALDGSNNPGGRPLATISLSLLWGVAGDPDGPSARSRIAISAFRVHSIRLYRKLCSRCFSARMIASLFSVRLDFAFSPSEETRLHRCPCAAEKEIHSPIFRRHRVRFCDVVGGRKAAVACERNFTALCAAGARDRVSFPCDF